MGAAAPAKPKAKKSTATVTDATVTFQRKSKPSETASTDATRPVLRHGHLRKRGKGWEIVTSNTYCLSVVPVSVDGALAECAITNDALKAIERAGSFHVTEDGIAPLGKNGAYLGVTYRQTDQEFTFPDWDKLLDGVKEHPFRVGLNAKILMQVAKAIGSDAVELAFDPDNSLRTIGVRALHGDGHGLLMPIRIDV